MIQLGYDMELSGKGFPSQMEKATHLVEAITAEREGTSDSLLHIEEVTPVVIQEQLRLVQKKELEESAATSAAVHDVDARLLKISEVLQTAARALRQVAESKAHAEEEANMWKKKYEQLRAVQVHRTERTVVQESIDGGHVVTQEKVVSFHPGSESTAFPVETTFPKKGLCSQRVLRSKSIPASSSNYDYRTVMLHVEPPEYGKVSFRLEWGSDGEKNSQYQQDVVTFESGNISTAACSNKQIMLVWDSPPQSVCILTKPNSISVHGLCKEMIRWLSEVRNMVVYVEPRVRRELLADDLDMDYLQTWNNAEDLCFLHNKIDLIITLGGDGTVLWAASLFKGPVPPVVSFAMGSLGFMTPFQSEHYKSCLLSVMKGPAYITLRHRLHCRIIRNPKNKALAGEEVHIVLNEVSIGRGMSPFITNLECYCDNIFVTNVQGDGLILSTPSGSTAYSLSAGGSMVHPQVAAILFTPICPHSLSFRPLILPEHVTVKLLVPLTSRGHAWVAFDGRDRVELGCGDALVCHLSSWPVPTAGTLESTHAFLEGVKEGLHWNMRKVQGEREVVHVQKTTLKKSDFELTV